MKISGASHAPAVLPTAAPGRAEGPREPEHDGDGDDAARTARAAMGIGTKVDLRA